MISASLIKDVEKQSSLKNSTKFLIDETLTTIIGIFQGKPVEEWTSEEMESLTKYRRFPNTKFVHKRESDGKAIIECSDAICLLNDYYASNPYGGPLKNQIIEAEKNKEDNEEFVEKKFRSDYDRQCDKEREILKILGDTRNKEFGHAIEEADMGEIYMWIRQLMKYLDCFSGYRMQILSMYDDRFGKPEDFDRLDDCYTKATVLKESCFATKENYKEFRFGKNRYQVAKDDKGDLELLILDMARSWKRGIDYLKREKTSSDFHAILEEYFDDYDMVMDYDDKHDEFLKTQDDSTKESILYMSLLYQIYPALPGLYWKGRMLSESEFASSVLQIISRHPGAYSFEDKRATLEYRINHLVEWNEANDTKRGLGIDLQLLCREHILTKYFKGQKDSKGVTYAKAFEAIILECKSTQFLEENYDEVIISVLSLTAYMRGRITYMLPIPQADSGSDKSKFKTFGRLDEFRKYFIKFISEAKSIEEIAGFVYKVRDDNNLKWFVEHSDSSLGKETVHGNN